MERNGIHHNQIRTPKYPFLRYPLQPFLVLYLTTTVFHLFRVGYDLPNYQISFTVLGSVIETTCITRSIYIYIYGPNPSICECFELFASDFSHQAIATA